MSFLRAACAALVGRSGSRRIFAAVSAGALTALFLSCGSGSSSVNGPVAYVSLPDDGSILILRVDTGTGALTAGGTTPVVPNTTPTGIALLPSKKFLYAANSRDDSISTFSVALDGTLSFVGTTPSGGSGPNGAAIDPSGQYLLVSNALAGNNSGNVAVFGISATGALSLIGSPVPANPNPTEIRFTHSGKFVYVTNPGVGEVTGFSFNASNGQLIQVTTVVSDLGADALAVDASDQYLYVANVSANNPQFPNITGNISGFSIDAGGGLNPLIGSPYIPSSGSTSGPSAIAVDPTGRFVYAVTAGSSASIWCFSITPANGELVPVANSPFSLAGGGLFLLFEPTGNFFYTGNNNPIGIDGYRYDPTTGVPTAVTGSPFSTGTLPGKMVISD
jgi:6-phosphogluconolactonase